GIDVSKSVVDAFIYSTRDKARFENTTKGLGKLLEWVLSRSNHCKEEMFFIFEHTGIYTERLTQVLTKEQLYYSIISGLEIKKSMGIVRGKDDRIDAARIALYGYRLREELQAEKPVGTTVKKLKSLAALRKRMIRERAGYKTSLKEQKQILSGKDYAFSFSLQKRMIKALTREIKAIENQLKLLIEKDQQLKEIYNLILSVKGVGTVTAISLIVHTNKFSKFQTWRQFASYCGIAPFPHRSGSSVKGRTKVSNLANKEIKTLLNMCALSAIKHNPEMKAYFKKRTALGKHKMSTINIIRNKLVSRIFAVVNRGTEYVDVLKYAC
ncbi:IS110 family transposase, partial [Aquimarina sp. U1-2]|uniref:IS110 family transposase n=1 Tax=Aquimarina sp. U1-2 TaxID=2823141 RepID=UPI001AECBC7E